jgi:nitric oxide reductase NorQ protein
MTSFIKSQNFKQKEILLDIAFTNKQAILLTGPTGCGKTTYVHDLCATQNKELVEVIGFEGLGVQDLVGHYIIQKDSSVFKKGPLLKAVEKGAVFYFDEVDTVLPEVRRLLFSLLENRQRTLYDYEKGEMIKVHDNFQFISSYNPDITSCGKLEQDFLDRFLCIDIDYLEPVAEAKLLQQKAGITAEIANKLVDIAIELRRSNELRITPPSTRLLLRSADMIYSMKARSDVENEFHAMEKVLELAFINGLTQISSVKQTLKDLFYAKSWLTEPARPINVMPFISPTIDETELADF